MSQAFSTDILILSTGGAGLMAALHAFLFSIGSFPTHAASSPPAVSFVSKPDEGVLLLDDRTVARSRNLTQHFFPAERHPANPVLRRSEKWEGVGPYPWGSRLMQDENSGVLRLWYVGYDFNGNFYRWGYATSRDGLNWNKPDLGLERLGGSPARNCLPLGPHPEKATRSIARDPRPETPPQRRYLGVRFTYEGEFVSFSSDGIAWTEYPQNPSWFVPSDIIHVLWDERRNHFVAYFKVWELTGSEIRAEASEPRPFTAYLPWFNQKQLTNETAQFDGPLIYFRTNGAAEVIKTNFVLRARNQGRDDGGGTSLSGDWRARRVQAWAESEDGIHWQNERVILRADDLDPPTANIQFMFVMTHGAYYLGFLTLHDDSGFFRIQLAWSNDGLHWNRSWREPWLDHGAAGAFDSGMVLGPADPILWEREMWFPYGGFPIRHDSPETNWESAIGLATMRLDGFAAWEAGAQAGELVTQPFVCHADKVFVNADAPTGSLQVEVLAAGVPIKGLETKACRLIRGDTLLRPADGWVRWKGGQNLSAVRGKSIQLRFILQNARLFSFRLADEHTMKLPSPRATFR